MKKWKVVGATVLTASLLLAGAPFVSNAAANTTSSLFVLAEVLKEGAKGENVKQMQRALNKAMGAELSEDGIFGPNTKTAVKAFQKSKNLVVDGIYGPKTHDVLSKAVNGSSEFPYSEVLKVGSKGEAVKALQKALSDLKYNVAVDGIYGPQTKAAVLQFQRDYPEIKDDGIFGPQTKALLELVLSKI